MKRSEIIGRMMLLLIVLFTMALIKGCTVYKQPQMKLTSVLAVTAEGDTLQLPIDVIRPIYNYNTYPTNRYPVVPNYFYYSPHRYQPVYGNSNYRPINNNNNNSNNSNNSNPVVPRVDRPVVNPTGGSTPVNPRKN